eukprot:1194318-Prorocentrum_minimum.AAC.6
MVVSVHQSIPKKGFDEFATPAQVVVPRLQEIAASRHQKELRAIERCREKERQRVQEMAHAHTRELQRTLEDAVSPPLPPAALHMCHSACRRWRTRARPRAAAHPRGRGVGVPYTDTDV